MAEKHIYHDKDKKSQRGRPIVCSKCGQGGGTLLKIDDDKYEHDRCPVGRVRKLVKLRDK